MLVKIRGKHGRNEVCDAVQRVKMPAAFWKSSRKDRRLKGGDFASAATALSANNLFSQCNKPRTGT